MTPSHDEDAHRLGIGCPACANWAQRDALREGLGQTIARWWQRLWRALFVAVAIMVLPTAAQAIPACWQVSPNAEIPWVPDSTPVDCGGKQAFVLEGVGAWSGTYLEIPESSLWVHGVGGADRLAPYIVWSFMLGPQIVIDPDLYVTQWLLGSSIYPHTARWMHEHGFAPPSWGPYDDPAPSPSPEPSTLILLATAGVLGWRQMRRRA